MKKGFVIELENGTTLQFKAYVVYALRETTLRVYGDEGLIESITLEFNSPIKKIGELE